MTAENDSFVYKELIEDYVDSISPREVSGLFGWWKIVEIAKTGGSLSDESMIRTQVGKRLYMDSTKVEFDFLGYRTLIAKPEFKVRIYNVNGATGPELKGTSFFHGYRLCRKNVCQIIVSDKLYLEFIHFQELTTYYAGRIYFLRRDN